MTPLQALEEQLAPLASVVETDLDSALRYINELREVLGTVRGDVYVDRAVVELENNAGYPVGHIVFDSQIDMYRFVPHIDTPNKREES